MKPSANLVFFGNERLSTGFKLSGAPTLEALIDTGYTISAVVANYEAGSSRSARKLEIAEVAKQHNIPVLLPNKPGDIKDQLLALKADAGVLVAYGKLVPQAVIDIFPKGILNIHPSLLPFYRGSTPIETAILDGAKQTGVSIMGLVKAMDAGPVYAQATLPLDGTETKQELTERLLQEGGSLLIKNLSGILDGTIQPRPQQESLATYTTQISKADAQLNTTKPAQQLEREVRAYAGWPKSKLDIFGNSVIVTSVRIASAPDDGALVISCNPGYLEIQTLIAPSGRTISGAEFLRGYKKV